MAVKEPRLYFLVLSMMAGVIVVAMGGGLFGQGGAWVMQWQHQSFSTLCHQMPDRSFWIGGQPMAVCSRCFGIYSGFLAGWLLLPLLAISGVLKNISIKNILLGIIVLNLIDILGNLLGFWQNTLVSRVVFGELAGLGAATLFSGSFFIKNHKQHGEHYGRVTTTNAGT